MPGRVIAWLINILQRVEYAIQAFIDGPEDASRLDCPDSGGVYAGNPGQPGELVGEESVSNRDNSSGSVSGAQKSHKKLETRQVNERGKILEIAGLLNVPAAWLDGLIAFETGGSYDPLAKNPTSSARGLIQVIDSTAQSLFGVNADTLVGMYPDFDSQMDNVVYPYLKRYMPFPTKQSLYMAVFYPRFRSVPPDTVFPESVQRANPGITTVSDYVDFVDRRVAVSRLLKTGGTAFVLVAGLVLYFYLRGRA